MHCDQGDRQAKEAYIVTVVPYADSNYACRPLVVLASCKSSTAGQQRDILQQVFDAWDVNCETQCGPLYQFFTDGDAPRRQAGEMMTTLELDKQSTLGGTLFKLKLFDLRVGPKERVNGKDRKHNIKRARTVVKSVTRGWCIGDANGFEHKSSSVKLVLIAAGYSAKQVNAWLKPEDDQSVSEAVQLMQAISSLREPTRLAGISVVMRPQAKDFVLLADIWDGSLAAVVDFTSDLTAIMTAMAKEAFIMLLAFRRHGTRLMPSQLYHDEQASIKCSFFTAAKLQRDFPGTNYHIYQDGTDRQELMHGRVRAITHNRSVDQGSLVDRLSAVAQMATVFEKHPSWDRGSRRQRATSDHANVRSTTGCRNVSKVNLDACWAGGRQGALEALRAHGAYPSAAADLEAVESSDLPVTMMRPFGAAVGVSVATLACVEVEEEEDAYDAVDTLLRWGMGQEARPAPVPPNQPQPHPHPHPHPLCIRPRLVPCGLYLTHPPTPPDRMMTTF